MTTQLASPREGHASISPSDCRVDCHVHVFDRDAWAMIQASSLPPSELGDADQLTCLLGSHGFTHALLVNPLAVHGTDNSHMLKVLGEQRDRFRGVALVEHGTSAAEFERMHMAGVRGIRFNLDAAKSPSLFDPGALRTLDIVRELGWFAQIHYEGDAVMRALPVLERARVRIVVDHCGRPLVKAGLGQLGFAALLEMGRNHDAIVKLSAAFRLGDPFPYSGTDDFVHALIDAFTLDRCVWGSDWPFLRAPHRIDHSSLLQALHRWLPAQQDRDKVLGINPLRIFDFALPRELELASAG